MAENYKHLYEQMKKLVGMYQDEIVPGMRKQIEELESSRDVTDTNVGKWIPVTERLPENDMYILATTDGVVVSTYWHNDRFYAFTANGVATVGCVTHWMPLPEKPNS